MEEGRGRMEEGKGKMTEEMGSMVQYMRWDGKGKKEGEGKGGQGLQPPNFNSWRRH